MRFWEALEKCYNGAKITRTDWNGNKNGNVMYIYYTHGSTIDVDNWHGNGQLTSDENSRGFAIINGHFDMYAADGTRVIGWLASQTDLVSANWTVVE